MNNPGQADSLFGFVIFAMIESPGFPYFERAEIGRFPRLRFGLPFCLSLKRKRRNVKTDESARIHPHPQHPCSILFEEHSMNRRELLKATGAAALGVGLSSFPLGWTPATPAG